MTSLSHVKRPRKMRHQDEAEDHKDTKRVCEEGDWGMAPPAPAAPANAMEPNDSHPDAPLPNS